uniref:Pre-rRNA-processing protein RIX1 N-terminal domain-containing protein n=1 Tax=Panstrongylus megistus TaxID=65343 RepID=A0A069DWB0_9HEMI
MNSTIDLLKIALGESDKYALKNFLQVCTDNTLFQRKDCNVENVVSLVNSLLNVNADYEKGVLILKVLLPQCKSDLVERNLLQWLQQCLKGLQSHSYLITTYALLRELLIYSKDYQDIRKQTALNIVSKILEHYFKNTRQLATEILLPFLQCLEQILLHYGKACGHWKNKIEQFLLQHLECSPAIVNACARCFLKISGIGPITPDMEVIKEQWYGKQKFLISALHTLLDRIYNHINEIQGTYEKYIVRSDSPFLPEISETFSLKNAQRLTVQFTSLADFLRIMLLGMFPVTKRIYPEAILSVICRGLSVTCTTLEANVSNDSIILATQIPAIHCACLNILDSLIQSCRRSLLPQAELICKLPSQTLKWTKVNFCEFGQCKPYSFLRVRAYNCLSTWLTVSRIGSYVQHYINDIIPSVLSDIHSQKPTIILNVSAKRLKGKVGKKERKKQKELQNLENKLTTIVNPLANKEVCSAALNFLSSLLESSFFLISPNIHKQLQEQIVSELLMVQTALNLSLDLPIPYADESCRLALYTTLLALCNDHHPKFPAPCNYAVHIFTNGLNDNSLLVSRFCGQAVANIDKMLHPIGPTLSCAIELSNEVYTSRNVPPTTTIGLNTNVGHLNGSITETDNNRTNQDHVDDSLVLESIPKLFENHILSESVSNDQGKNENNNIVKATEEQHIQQTEINESYIKMQETQIKENDITTQIEKNIYVQERIAEENKIISPIEIEKHKRKLNNEIISEIPKEKKRKEDNREHFESEINDLEKEMLSSFVDIIGGILI